MTLAARSRSLLLTSLFAAACGGSPATTPDAAPGDAPRDTAAALDAFDPKAAPCAATFGSDLAPAFGRFDGTVLAIVPPGDEDCALPNSTHLVVQATIAGTAYRLVVDVLSSDGNPDVFFHEIDAPLVGSAWAEGWHTGAQLDYVTTLAQTSTAFTEMPEAQLVSTITAEITLGTHISIFATSGASEPSSAHLVHRNATNADGAIVLSPEGAGSAHWLLMRFDEQTF